MFGTNTDVYSAPRSQEMSSLLRSDTQTSLTGLVSPHPVSGIKDGYHISEDQQRYQVESIDDTGSGST